MNARVDNPVLRGFNPDPSICRVDDDFYVATSTFEWYPGVQIHHSRDLRHWRLLTRPLAEKRLLDMPGVPDSCGVWAPCLSWADGRFWLAYTVVRRFDGNFKDTHNYVTTADDLCGPWSDPVYLNSSGFDPSLFHDADGRKWFLNMVWDHRPDRSFFGGIVMQEFDAGKRELIGAPLTIFEGTELGYTEGPHLYRFGGYYYLLTAEGGTGYGHAVSVARSPSLTGPYETDPAGPLITARDAPDWPLQRAGHGDLAELDDGSYCAVFLCSRRSEGMPHSPMGRETAVQRLRMSEDGWLRTEGGSPLPELKTGVALDRAFDAGEAIEHDDFDEPRLDIVYQWLRTAALEECFSLDARPGYLRLYGMESPGSLYRQTLIARRQTEYVCTATTLVEFEPSNPQQMAGLIVYYNASKFHYLYVSWDEEIGRHLGIMSSEAEFDLKTTYPIHADRISLPETGAIGLRMAIDHASVRCEWSLAGNGETAWRQIPAELDMRFLTDQAGKSEGEQFTGTFIGVCAHDVSGQRAHADFDYLTLQSSSEA